MCGEKGTATFESGSALGHTGGTATCQRKAICARCGEEYGDFAPHDYSNDWTSDSAKHWHACKVCGIKSSVASHVPGPAATETEAQICSVCGRILQAASGHIHNGVVVKATSPTCLSGGNIEYFVCSCGLAFFDVECKNVVDDLSSLIIPPEHDAHSDADNDGLCDTCGSAMTPKETSSETSLTEPDVESTATESTTTESSATESVTESSASAETTPEDTAAETSHGRVVFSSGFSKIIESVKNFFDSLPKKGEDGYIVFIAVIALSGAVLLTLVVVIPIKAAKRKRRRKNSKNSKNN